VHEVTTAVRAVERALSSAPHAPAWASLVGRRLIRLRGAYIKYLERSMGGTTAAVQDNPWLSSHLLTLRRDQAKLADELDRLIEACTHASDVESLRQQVTAVLGRVARVREREVSLLYESVDLELGGEQ